MQNKLQGRFPYTVPNYHVNTGYDRLTMGTMPWQGSYATNQAKEEANIDRLWETVARNIAYEQAIKEEQQQALNRETVRMIKELDEYDKARKMRRDINNETEIQDLNNALYQSNEIADNYEGRTQLNDYNSYEVNLSYKQEGVNLGIWREGSPGQYATFASDLPQLKTDDNKLFWQSSVEDNEKMNMNYPVYVAGSQVVTPLGLGTSSILTMNGRDRVRTTTAGIGIYDYDPVFAHEVYEVLRTDEYARTIWEEAKGIFGEVLLEQILDIMMLSAPAPLRTPIYVCMLLAGFCECAKTLREEAVKKYKEEHHCSEEEARRNARYDKELLAEICTLFINEGLNHILKKWNWLPTDIQSILNSTIKSIADRIVTYMTEQLF